MQTYTQHTWSEKSAKRGSTIKILQVRTQSSKSISTHYNGIDMIFPDARTVCEQRYRRSLSSKGNQNINLSLKFPSRLFLHLSGQALAGVSFQCATHQTWRVSLLTRKKENADTERNGTLERLRDRHKQKRYHGVYRSRKVQVVHP